MLTVVAIGHIAYGCALNSLLVATVLICLARLLPMPQERQGIRPLESAERLLAFGLVLSATIVSAVTLGGTMGLAGNRPAMLLLVLTLAVASALGRSPASLVPGTRNCAATLLRDARILVASVLAEPPLRVACLCVGVPWVLLFCQRALSPPVAWDALTYHLFFPLHWIQSGHLNTLVQPVGEPSSPFYPLAGEMHFYWGLLSAGSDAWTALAQTPFLVLGSLAVASIARLQGGARTAAVVAAALWASLPVALRQSVEPMVDLAQPSFFLLATFFLLRWKAEGGAWRCLMVGAALGLTIGVKYTGLIWAVSLSPLIVAAFSRPKVNRRRFREGLLAMGIAVALGGYSYFRNLWVGGNPVLPIQVTIAGHTLLPGTRAMATYFGSGLHQSVWGALIASPRALLDLGIGLPACIAGAVVSVALPVRNGTPGKAAPIAALLGLCLFLLAIPYREPRHLLVPAGLMIAVIPGLLARFNFDLHGRLLVAALPAINFPFAIFYWARDLAQSGPDLRHAIAGLAVSVLLISICCWIPSGLKRESHPRTSQVGRWSWQRIAIGAIAMFVCLFGALSWYEAGKFEAWERYWSTRVAWGEQIAREDFADAGRVWRILAKKTRHDPCVIAYSGSNIPYPLAGFGLNNEVRFVPRNKTGSSWQYGWTRPVPDPFRDASVAAWRTNVTALGVRYLCIFRESKENDPKERFPIEAEWADADPSFQPVWLATWARVYEVARRGPAPQSIRG